MERKHDNRRVMWVSVGLAAVTVAVYWPVLHFGFINYDDSEYITENLQVRAGLTWRGLVWAFTQFHAWNWHPVTWLSHMLDWQLYGARAGGHHASNLLIHVLNVVLAFAVLRQMTGAFWRSAVVAGLFAVHPLHVESVAWVSERKDVLSGLFFWLTLWAYGMYVRRQGQSPESTVPRPRSTLDAPRYYALTLFFFALGLMSKPMVVTLPFVLLLLDYWPLRRVAWPGDVQNRERLDHTAELKPLLLEKVPFFVLSLGSSLVTYLAQSRGGAVLPMDALPLSQRLANAAVAYVRYAVKAVWPTHLAAFYPHPGRWPNWEVASCALAVLLVTGAVLIETRKRPVLVVGWLWFLGTLVPVIGLVQVGSQSMADRYTYLPLIGLFLMAVWGGTEFAAAGFSAGNLRVLGFGAATAALGLCAADARMQLGYWKESEALFTHTLEVSPENSFSHFIWATRWLRKANWQMGSRTWSGQHNSNRRGRSCTSAWAMPSGCGGTSPVRPRTTGWP